MLSLGVKWSGSEADHSTPYSAQIKNLWRHTSSPHYSGTYVVNEMSQNLLQVVWVHLLTKDDRYELSTHKC